MWHPSLLWPVPAKANIPDKIVRSQTFTGFDTILAGIVWTAFEQLLRQCQLTIVFLSLCRFWLSSFWPTTSRLLTFGLRVSFNSHGKIHENWVQRIVLYLHFGFDWLIPHLLFHQFFYLISYLFCCLAFISFHNNKRVFY